MTTHDENTFENTANAKGSGGDLQSKVMPTPNTGANKAPQKTENERRPEPSDQTKADN